MNSDLPAGIRLHRVAILGAWRDGFARSLEDSCLTDLDIPGDLLPAYFEEMLALLEGGTRERMPCHHRPPAVGQLAEFPTNISVGLKLLSAGEAAIRDFLIGSSFEFALESEFDRECILRDLNKAAHILIHREIQDICEQSLRPLAEICGQSEEHGGIRCRRNPDTATASYYST